MISSNPQASTVDAEEARRLMRKSGLEIDETIDLDPSHYQAIVHEQENETLVFTPAKGRERRLVVQLGVLSDLPKILLLQKTNAGWIDFLDPKAYVI